MKKVQAKNQAKGAEEKKQQQQQRQQQLPAEQRKHHVNIGRKLLVMFDVPS